MDTGNLKNIVVLKDLPSNLIEEAIVVLKENQKVPKLEPASKDKKEQRNFQNEKGSKDYIIKEAQMLIAEYISKIENKNKKENQSIQKLNNKCARLKKANKILIIALTISIIINFVI